MSSAQPNRPSSPPPLDAIGRMTAIMASFDDDLELAQIDFVRRTGLPKATVHRTVGKLVEHGWLQQLGDRYRLGTQLFEMGSRVARIARLRDAALPSLEELYAESKEVVNLGVLDGSSVIYIHKIGGHRSMSTPARQGLRFSANCTALGKAILAHSSPAVTERALSSMEARTPNTITDPDALIASLEDVRERGFAIDEEEFELGMRCCAAPIRGTGHAVAAVSVTGPTQRIDASRIGALVAQTAAAISRSHLGAL